MKIIFGAMAMKYLEATPKDQWFRQACRQMIKSNPALKKNAQLR